MNLADAQSLAARIRTEIAKAVVGQHDTIDLMLTSLFAGGHILPSKARPAPPRLFWPKAWRERSASNSAASSSRRT